MEQSIRPLGDRVLVDPDPAEEKTKNAGLIIPDSAKSKPVKGTVLAVGPFAQTVKEGNRVMYSEHAGTRIVLNEKSFLMMREAELFGIID